MTDHGPLSELRVPRNPHTFVRLQIGFWACLALAVWGAKQVPWGTL